MSDHSVYELTDVDRQVRDEIRRAKRSMSGMWVCIVIVLILMGIVTFLAPPAKAGPATGKGADATQATTEPRE